MTTNSRFSLRLFFSTCALALVTSAAGCVEAPAEDDSDEEPISSPLADGEERVNGEHLATLELAGGSRLIFIGLGEGDEETVAVVSATAPGARPLSALPELADASPLEIFNAASPAGTQIPDTIARLYGRQSTLGPQGWALEQVGQPIGDDPSMLQTGHCNNANFTAAVNAYGYNDHGPAIRLDQEPGIDAQGVWDFYEDCFDQLSECPSYYKYERRYADIDAFYGRVAVCALDEHPSLYTSWGTVARVHPGPTIQFWYRSPGATSYSLAYSTDVSAGQVGTAWDYHGIATNYDFKAVVIQAEAHDGFDIGTAGEDF